MPPSNALPPSLGAHGKTPGALQVFDQLISDPAFGGRYVSITPGHKNFIDAKEYQVRPTRCALRRSQTASHQNPEGVVVVCGARGPRDAPGRALPQGGVS